MSHRSSKSQAPILIVGAGRSGTNLLAMALDQVSGVKNVYEQRYVWMKGQSISHSDIRGQMDAKPSNANYIRNHFKKIGQTQRVVDKTPSNSLRLPFCQKVFPDAQIISVVRNPLDNVASRLREFHLIGQNIISDETEPGTKRNRLSVLRDRITHAMRIIQRGNIPIERIPFAFVDQAKETLNIFLKGRTEKWGERVPGLAELRKAHGVEIAATHQWFTCNMHIKLASQNFNTEQFLEVTYEDLVLEPFKTGSAVAKFLNLEDPQPMIDYLVENANADTVGRHRDRMSKSQSDAIFAYLAAVKARGSHPWAS